MTTMQLRLFLVISTKVALVLVFYAAFVVVYIPHVSRSNEYGVIETERSESVDTYLEEDRSTSSGVISISSSGYANVIRRQLEEAPVQSPKRHVILLGAHERFNFGDLLTEKIVSKLLITKLDYRDDEIIRAATIPRNMTQYGGHDNIVSMMQAQDMSRNSPFGPFDIIYTGGETLGCKSGCAVRMLDNPDLMRLGSLHKIYDCGYVIPKELLLPLNEDREPDRSVKNVAIANSLGGYEHGVPECKEALDTADYISFRDSSPLAPDCIVMVKELYGDLISSTTQKVRKSLFPGDVNKKYVAVQFSFFFGYYSDNVPETLDDLARKTNCTIVLFASGTAPSHDNINMYKKVASQMNERVIVYEGENVWESVATIAGAEAVVGTNIYVREISFVYHKPRITWCEKKEDRKFIGIWEALNEHHCDDLLSTWDSLSKYWGETPAISQDQTIETYKKMIKKYMASFDKWSMLLNETNKIQV